MNKLPGFLMIPLLIFLSISIYQTALGFTQMFGSAIMSWLFSIAIGVMMFFLAYLIGQQKIQHGSVKLLVLLYFVCSLISYAGNFNAFYSEYMLPELYKAELTEKREELGRVTNASEKALTNFNPNTTKTRNRVLALKIQLVSQIKDPANPGIGQRASVIISQIESLLGEKLTEFSGTPKQIATQYDKNIDQIINQKIDSGDFGKVKGVKEKQRDVAIAVTKKIDSVLSQTSQNKYVIKNVITEAVKTINSIGYQTQELISDERKFAFQPAKFDNVEGGKIIFSFKSATDHVFSAIVLTIISFILDWLGLLIVLVYASLNLATGNESKKIKLKTVDTI